MSLLEGQLFISLRSEGFERKFWGVVSSYMKLSLNRSLENRTISSLREFMSRRDSGLWFVRFPQDRAVSMSFGDWGFLWRGLSNFGGQ